MPSPAMPFSWSRHADEVAEFIDRFGAGPAHVVGHSRGGCVTFHFARRHPERVRTLTLADPGGPLQIAGRPPARLPETVNALRAKAAQLIEAGEVEGGPATVRRFGQPARLLGDEHAGLSQDGDR